MKKLFILYATAILFNSSIAQNVAINNDGSLPTIGAMLDVKSSNKGLLIPRIALTGTNDILTVPNRPEGLLVYNTASTAGGNPVAPGFYYWDGIAWVRLTNNTSSLFSGWMLGGNNGTSPSTHFIGTTDNNSLQIKVNNQPAGYIGKEANDGNVFWGYESGKINTGYSNVAVGIRALNKNTTVSNLVAIGDSALFNNISGPFNTAVGSKSLLSNISGLYNTALGFESLKFNTTGSLNTAIGFHSLAANTEGTYNTATGVDALRSNTTGTFNTANGWDALYANTAGNVNTAIGLESLKANTGGGGNTAIGVETLLANITGDANTALGYQSNVLTGVLSNATAIGAYARVDCSNCLVLGSVNSVNSATSNVNIGIGETNPRFPLSFGPQLGDKISIWSNSTNSYGLGIQSSLLQIHTDISAADIALGYGSSAAFTENMRIKGNGNVGIGVSSPAARLHIMNGTSGGVAPSSNLLIESNGTNYMSMLAPDASANAIWFSKPSALLGGGIFYNDPNVPDGFIFRANNVPRMTIKNNGNVGIGLNNPQSKLHIMNGSSGYIGAPLPDLVVESSTNTYLNFLTPNASESGIIFGQASNAVNGGIVFNNSANPNSIQFRVAGNTTAVIIDNNQRLGIRMSPPSPLSVGQIFGGTDMIGLYSLALFGGYTDNWHIGIGSGSALYFSSGNSQVAHVDATTGNWISISDQSLKKNIQPLLLVLPRLMQLNAVSYQMKTQTDDEKTFGFLAQEMQKIFPEAVKTFGAGDKQKLGIAYTELIPLVVTAIQEQQKTIQQLQREIDELKKLIKQ